MRIEILFQKDILESLKESLKIDTPDWYTLNSLNNRISFPAISMLDESPDYVFEIPGVIRPFHFAKSKVIRFNIFDN